MKKSTTPLPADVARPFVMDIADKLSDDPMLLQLLGPRFKVIVDYDAAAKRVTYSFRAPDDVGSDEHDATVI